jgi:hypothetical protein
MGAAKTASHAPPANMPEAIRIHLTYRGPAVDGGSMPLGEVSDALVGFTEAYAKVAARRHPRFSYELQLSAIEAGSFDVVILAATTAAHLAVTAGAAEVAKQAARWVVEKIAEFISLKKHTRGERFSVEVHGDGNKVSITNVETATIVVSRDAAELLQARTIDGALSKITAPLAPHKIESAEISSEGGGAPVKAVIRSEERDPFRLKPRPMSSRETQVDG